MGSIEDKPSSADARAAAIGAAFALVRDGRLDDARTLFSEYMHDEKFRIDAHRGLAAIAWRRQQPDAAIQLLTEAVRLAPDHRDARGDLALTLMMAGRLSESLVHWNRRVELAPEDAAAWHNLAKCLGELKRFDDAFAAFEQALTLDPGQVGTYVTYARTLESKGDRIAAEAVWKRALQVDQSNESAFLGLAELQFGDGRLNVAMETYRNGVLALPHSADLHLRYGQLLEDFSDRAGAEAEFRKALELRPGWALALEALLTLLRKDATDQDVDAAKAILGDPRRPIVDQANVGFGLGKALDSKGDVDGAMMAWRGANAARRLQIGAYDRKKVSDRVDRLTQEFSEGFFQRAREWGVDDPRPVFVVGMPRSGTSLVEQILSSHPDAYGYGELPEIPKLAKGLPARLGSIQRWPEVVSSLTPDVIRDIATAYIGELMRREATSVSRLIDKAPMNFFYVGLIAAMFPRAHVVWCRRDPRDIGLSIYAENFGLSQNYATDLADIGFYYREYARLMRHWQTVCGGQIYTCVYEDMINDPEQQSRALVDAIGLPWNENCLRFYEHDRPVLTPSRWQVRTPIYRRAVSRWERYGDALAPLIAALGDELPSDSNG